MAARERGETSRAGRAETERWRGETTPTEVLESDSFWGSCGGGSPSRRLWRRALRWEEEEEEEPRCWEPRCWETRPSSFLGMGGGSFSPERRLNGSLLASPSSWDSLAAAAAAGAGVSLLVDRRDSCSERGASLRRFSRGLLPVPAADGGGRGGRPSVGDRITSLRAA